LAAETAAAGLFELRVGGATGFCPLAPVASRLSNSFIIDRLQATVNSLGARLCIIDAKGFVISVNPEAERLLGCRESELAGVSLLERIASQQNQSKKSQVLTAPKQSPSKSEDAAIAPTLGLQEARASGQPSSNWEDQFQSHDGKILPVSYFFNPAVEGGEISVLVFFDILTLTLLENTSNCSRCCKQF
jgi:PAS domain-containing protein